MTGWRIGWMVLPEAVLRKTQILQQNLFISAPTLSQVAARVALGERGYSEAQKARYAANRHIVGEWLATQGLGDGHEPDGAFYAYVDMSRYTNDSLSFCQAMVREAGVATTPGIDFDRLNGNRYVRLSYAGTGAAVAEGLDRIAAFLRRR
jgi:aspartate/methionine/tyrosine aminotransferase